MPDSLPVGIPFLWTYPCGVPRRPPAAIRDRTGPRNHRRSGWQPVGRGDGSGAGCAVEGNARAAQYRSPPYHRVDAARVWQVIMRLGIHGACILIPRSVPPADHQRTCQSKPLGERVGRRVPGPSDQTIRSWTRAGYLDATGAPLARLIMRYNTRR